MNFSDRKMEGLLDKKGGGESMFGRRNWKQRYFTLDGTVLRYYAEFDFNTGVPSDEKGQYDLQGCKVERLMHHHDRQFVFSILATGSTKTHYMSAPNEAIMNLWLKAVCIASGGSNAEMLQGRSHLGSFETKTEVNFVI
jgi:hypothetical protein